MSLQEIPPQKMAAMLTRAEAEREQRRAQNRLAAYKPYRKQSAFHEAGATHRERLLIAATSRARALPAEWRPPCMRQGAIQMDGRASAFRSRPSVGVPAPLTRRRATPYSGFWSDDRDSTGQAAFRRMQFWSWFQLAARLISWTTSRSGIHPVAYLPSA